jgi:hypothetical protein
MALALLFAQHRRIYELEEPGQFVENTSDHAFIVDHKARPESTEEAKWVAEQCRTQCEWQFS